MHLSFIKPNIFGILVFIFVSLCLLYFYNLRPRTRQTVSLKHLLAVSIGVAEIGGLKVKDVRLGTGLQERSKGKTREGANDPLTEGDIQSHRAMIYGLKSIFPELKVISEEHDNGARNYDGIAPNPRWDVVNQITDDAQVPISDVNVWIDPLDATQEYTENLLQYVTTMVCVAVRGEPVIGVIHQPFNKHTSWAWVGHGVSPDLASVSSHNSNSPKSPVVIVSRSHAGEVKKFTESAFGPDTVIIPAGGAGYKVLQVIHGNATVYLHITLIKKWDICAGNALLNALGGRMTTLIGQTLFYGSSDNAKNEGGIIAALYNHDQYLSKLNGVKIRNSVR